MALLTKLTKFNFPVLTFTNIYDCSRIVIKPNLLRGQTLCSCRALSLSYSIAKCLRKQSLEQITAATGTTTIAVVMGIN